MVMFNCIGHTNFFAPLRVRLNFKPLEQIRIASIEN